MVGTVDERDPSINNASGAIRKRWIRTIRSWGWFLLVALPLFYLLLFYALPVLEIFQKGFINPIALEEGSKVWQTVSRTLGFTVWQALISTVLTLALGLPAAFVLYRFQFRGRTIIRMLTAIPFILPTVVVAAGFNALIGPRGWINLVLQNIFKLDSPPLLIVGTLSAILIAHVFYNLTIVIRLVGNAWSGLNPRLEMTARTLGANPFQTFRHITLPLLSPVIAAATILVFLFDFTSFGVILLLGGPQFATLEVEVYTQTMSLFNLPLASILALLQLGCTLTLTVLFQFFSSRPVPMGPVDERKNLILPVKWTQKVFILITVIVLCALILSPLASLLSRSIYRSEADRGQRGSIVSGLTFDYYRALLVNPRQDYFYIPPVMAIWNSIKFGLITAFLSLFLGLMIVYGFRRGNKYRKILDTLLMLPLGTSAVTLGIGYVIFFNRPPLLWGASQWLIPMAHTLVALPFVVRGLYPAIGSIPLSFRQSASLLGASPMKVFWLIDLPLIQRTLLSSMVFAFTISLGEFGATSFLARPEFPTIPVAIFRFLSQPGGLNYGQAMAMATILMLVCAAGILFFEQSFFLSQDKERI